MLSTIHQSLKRAPVPCFRDGQQETPQLSHMHTHVEDVHLSILLFLSLHRGDWRTRVRTSIHGATHSFKGAELHSASKEQLGEDGRSHTSDTLNGATRGETRNHTSKKKRGRRKNEAKTTKLDEIAACMYQNLVHTLTLNRTHSVKEIT